VTVPVLSRILENINNKINEKRGNKPQSPQSTQRGLIRREKFDIFEVEFADLQTF